MSAHRGEVVCSVVTAKVSFISLFFHVFILCLTPLGLFQAKLASVKYFGAGQSSWPDLSELPNTPILQNLIPLLNHLVFSITLNSLLSLFPIIYLCSLKNMYHVLCFATIHVVFGGPGSSVGRACNSWWGGPWFDSRCGRLPYWLGRCQYNVTGWDRSHI